MKKLRQIIRESIKELVNEQTIHSLGCMQLRVTKCAGTGPQPIGAQFSFPCPHVNGHFATQDLVGRAVKHDGTMNTSPAAFTDIFTVDEVLPNNTYPFHAPNSSLETTTCTSTNPGCTADFSTNGPCAHQWLPNANWVNTFNWSNYTDCNSLLTLEDLQNDAVGILISQGINLGTIPGVFTDWNHINSYINGLGLQQPYRGQVKRKMAKGHWAECMMNACNC